MAFGIHTHQEQRDIQNVLAALTNDEQIEFVNVANDIAMVQRINPSRKFSDYNFITKLEVVTYFNALINIPGPVTAVTHSTSGLPTGMTRITRITWAT